MPPMVGVIGDEGTEYPKLIVGYFISSESVAVIDGKMRIYLSEKKPYIVFSVGERHIDTPGPFSRSRGRVELNYGKKPQYYYPTFDQLLDKNDPENTFKKRCTIAIMDHAKKIRDVKDVETYILAGALEFYSDAARIFMREAEDLFKLNWP